MFKLFIFTICFLGAVPVWYAYTIPGPYKISMASIQGDFLKPEIELQVEGITYADLACLSYAIHHEARGESMRGQQAVVHTILNRYKSPRYPNDICHVVYQPHQFTGLFPDKEYKLKKETVRIAYSALLAWHKGQDVTGGATMYYNPDKAKPRWNFAKLEKTVKIGAHKFFKEI